VRLSAEERERLKALVRAGKSPAQLVTRADTGNSIYQNIEPVYKTMGDVRDRAPYKLRAPGDLYLIPGDLRLSNFEDLLGDTWSSAKGGSEPALRAQSAIHRYIQKVTDKV
jgi:chromosome partitioning protein